MFACFQIQLTWCSWFTLYPECDEQFDSLGSQVDAIKNTLANDEQKIGAEIVRRSLGYPLKLIANNAGVNGSVVQQKVLESSDPNIGYNASTGQGALTHAIFWEFVPAQVSYLHIVSQ